ncbi:MAG: Hsp33 family molecular chaperone HslO, partial [Firmicutes bacterium]|nr:Hsp33 family molecular chaperone HslO [Bacillota bacterium]
EMSNALIAIDKSGSFRVCASITTDLVQEAAKIHDTTPTATAGLGRVLTAAGMMGILMKDEGSKLTVNFKGEGPAKQILATAYADGRVKGYIANPYVDLPLTEAGKLDVGGSLGIGELSVIRDLGLKEPYMGTIALVNGEIAEDLTAYFFISEQKNTSVALGVKIERDLTVGAAGGMIIQMLPDADEGAVDALEEMIGQMEPITTTISRLQESRKGWTDTALVRAMVAEIFSGLPEEYEIKILEEREIKWDCDCSRERIEQALMTIGEEDLQQILDEDGQAELQCQFCLKKYQFDRPQLQAILDSISK